MNEEQIERYRQDGFLLLPGMFAAEELDAFEQRFVALASGEEQAPSRMIVMRDVMVVRGAVDVADPVAGVNKILSFEDDPSLFAYALSPDLLAAVRALVGPSIETISTNVFNKPPGLDSRHPLHQDLRYFTLRPADGIVGTWTAISRCTRENGCLAVVPGSHRGPLFEHASPEWEYVNYDFFAAKDAPTAERVHLEMQPGDTLLLHPLLLHGSGRNKSTGYRRAISAHFASLDCTRSDGPRKREPVTMRIPDSQG